MTVPLLSVGTTWAGQAEMAAAAQKRDDYVAALNRGDYAAELTTVRFLAAQGNATEQHNLGVMYENGRGVAKDYAEAFKWYRLAGEQGDARAQVNLGVMYEEGLGVA